MLIPRKPKYELVSPSEDDNGNWKIRITKGPFEGTVYEYDTLTPCENSLKYSFILHESPVQGLTEENRGLQKTVENILVDIMKKELYGNQSRTSNSQ
jgi:hypothetical protein